jgi:hypothetical protein
MDSLKKTARTAGFWYLIMALQVPVGIIMVPSNILVNRNADIILNELYQLTICHE